MRSFLLLEILLISGYATLSFSWREVIAASPSFTVQTSQRSYAGLEDPDIVLMWALAMRVSVPFLFINIQ